MEKGFTGCEKYKIDSKKRIAIPAIMREQLGKDFVLSRGFGDCLALFPSDEWDIFMHDISTKAPRKKRRTLELYYNRGAKRMNLDAQGRIYLTPMLLEKAFLTDEKEAYVLGNNNRIEIWNCSVLDGIDADITYDEIEDILDEAGI